LYVDDGWFGGGTREQQEATELTTNATTGLSQVARAAPRQEYPFDDDILVAK
jgi:hypothetical protein